MNDDDSQSELAKKRTARVQLTNGALEARAYVGPTPVPVEDAHKTIEMRTVAVDESFDPRRKATVARGMGEALGMLQGDVIDPTTGRVLPPVDPHAVPDTPWAQGKRPTHIKGSAPPLVRAPGAGVATSAASQPGYGAYIAAGGIVTAALFVAVVIVTSKSPSTPASSSAPATGPLAPETARPVDTAVASPPNAAAVLPAASVAPTASAAAPSDSGTGRQVPIPRGSLGAPAGKGTPARPPASAPKPGDRIF